MKDSWVGYISRVIRKFALSLLVVLVLAGCSASPRDGAVQRERGPVADLESSPLVEFEAAIYGPLGLAQEDAQAAAQARRLREAELVAECMHAQGFEHIPWYPGMGSDEVSVAEASASPMESAQQWGYRVFTIEPVAGTPAGFVDPNLEVVATMSAAEEAAYYAALMGWSGAEAGSLTQSDGCEPWAAQELNVVTPETELVNALLSDPRYTELMDAIDLIPVTVAQSSEMGEVNASWSECMAEAGYDYDRPEDAEYHFETLGTQITDRTSPQAREAKSEEIATAVADQQCRIDTGYDDNLQQLTWQTEDRVLKTYREDADALQAAIEQGAA